MFSALRHSSDRLAAALRIALAVGVGCVFSGAAAAMAASTVSLPAGAKSTSTASPTSPSVASSAQMLRFAWLRDGQSQLWQFNAGGAADGLVPQSARPLPATLETPLGSVWKLFVYGYLVDRNIATPDYTCSGGDPEEVYCCMTGGHIDREHALVQSCGRFFEPARLQLDPEIGRAHV